MQEADSGSLTFEGHTAAVQPQTADENQLGKWSSPGVFSTRVCKIYAAMD